MSSPESPMNKVQLRTVKTALQFAIEDGMKFASIDAMDEYLMEAGVSAELLAKHGREVFNCYLQLQHQLEAPPSPPPSETQGKASSTSLEGEDLLDQGDAVAPIFDSEETAVLISVFRSRLNDFQLLTAKTCKGNCSYISEIIARKHHLKSGRENIILTWRYTGGEQSNRCSRTRCKIVKAELLLGCDIAFGEECGKEDSEESEEEEGKEDDGQDEEESAQSTNKSQFNEMSNDLGNDMVVYRSFETLTIDLSPEQESRVLQNTAEMNLKAAMSMEKQKATRPFSLPPYPPTPQRSSQNQRSRRS